MNKQQIYLDNSAATPVRKEVLKVMNPFFTKVFGNASSLHKQGVLAKSALENARSKVAKAINSRSEEIVFTAGGTESCNLAILGTAFAHNGSAHIITTQIEHAAVLEPIKFLQKRWGWRATYLPVNRDGLIKVKDLIQAVKKDTVLISIIHANNEIGTIEPIGEIGKWLSGLNSKRQKQGLKKIYFHTDACQAAGYLDINVQRLGVDLMTLNGGKICGPKQTGVLFVKNGVSIKSQIFGGGQEKGIRSGTENVAGMVGLAQALELAQKERSKLYKHTSHLSKYCFKKIQKEIPGVKLNGVDLNSSFRLPNNLNFSVKGVLGEDLALYLDAKGICVSTGSACSAGLNKPSHVLEAIGLMKQDVLSSIRVTLGKGISKKQIDRFVQELAIAYGHVR